MIRIRRNSSLTAAGVQEVLISDTDDSIAVGDGSGNKAGMTSNALWVRIKASDVGASGGTSMTDDSAFTAGTSSLTPVGGVYQATPDSVDDGDTGALRMTIDRILLATISGALPAGTNNIGDVDVASLPGTVASDITACKTALEILDNAISGNEMQVDVLTMPTVAVTGTFWQSTQPVSIAAAVHVDDNSGSLTVDGTVAATQSGTWNINNIAGTVSLPTGAATETSLAACKTALEIIDNAISGNEMQVDVVTMPTVAVTGTFWQATQPVSGTFWQATQPVSIAAAVPVTDNSGTLSVDDGAGSLTVDGTVGISGSVAVTGTFWQATQPVSAAALPLPSGASTEATLASCKTALELLDDAIYTDGTGTPSKGILIMGSDGTNPQSIITDATGHLQVDVLTVPSTVVTATHLDIRHLNATDDIVHIQDGGDSITVDGTVGVSGSVAVTGTFWQSTQPVSLASLPSLAAGSNNIGDVDILSIAAGDNNIGNVDLASAIPAGTNIIGKVSIADIAGDSCMDESNNALKVNIVAGGGSGGTAMADDAAFTLGTTNVTPIAGVFATDNVDAGDAGALAMTQSRALHVYIKGTDVGSSGGTSMTDDAAFTPATTAVTPAGGVYQATPDSVDDGDCGALRMTVDRKLIVDDGGGALTVDGTVTANLSATDNAVLDAIQAAVETIDNAISGSEMQVDVVSMPTTTVQATHLDIRHLNVTDDAVVANQGGTWNITNVSGTVSLPTGASTETTLAACKTALELIDNAISGTEMQCDIVAALPAGDNNIGNVDVVTLPAVTLAAAQTLATLTSITNVVHVDDNAGSLTVDGTVTANLSATDNAVLDSIQTAVETVAGAVSATHMQCDIVGALPAGSAAIGKLAANSGVDIGDVDVTSMTCAAANAKVDIGLINAVTPLMGNGVTGTGSLRVTLASDTTANSNPFLITGGIAHDAGDSGSPVKVGAYAINALPTSVSNADRVNMVADLKGRLITTPNVPRELVGIQQTTITSSVSETTIVTAAASTFKDLLSLVITNSSATALIVTLKDSTGGTTRGIYAIAANGGIVINFATPMPQATVNNNWTLTCGTSVASIYVVATFANNT